MIPARIDGCTRVMGAPENWSVEENGPCSGLPIRDEVIEGLPVMVSVWEPTPDELAQLKLGAKVRLMVVGTGHPIVNLSVRGL